LFARLSQARQHVERGLVLIGSAHLQVNDYTQQILGTRPAGLDGADRVANYI
jgi:hypothetical protein